MVSTKYVFKKCSNIFHMHNQAILVVDKIGRRVLLIVSSLVMGLSLYGLGTFFYVKDNEDIVCPEDAVRIFLNYVVCVISHTFFFSGRHLRSPERQVRQRHRGRPRNPPPHKPHDIRHRLRHR